MARKPEDGTYTARGLGALCGVSERTIRYYVEQGILPAPRGRGRGSHFDDDHLVRLKLVRAMQKAGVELAAIAEYLEELEGELKARGAGLGDALAIWTGRNEQAEIRAELRKRWGGPVHALRYRVAEGVELVVDMDAMPEQRRMQSIVQMLRQAFEEDDGGE